MTPADVWTQARTAFANSHANRHFTGAPVFIRESDIRYDDSILEMVVPSNLLFAVDDEATWQPLLHPTPTWLNVSFLIENDEVAVFSLARSTSYLETADPRHCSVNISGPSNWAVRLEG